MGSPQRRTCPPCRGSEDDNFGDGALGDTVVEAFLSFGDKLLAEVGDEASNLERLLFEIKLDSSKVRFRCGASSQ